MGGVSVSSNFGLEQFTPNTVIYISMAFHRVLKDSCCLYHHCKLNEKYKCSAFRRCHHLYCSPCF